ncbi:hypothetical protein M3J09_009498 [Ascochyta lentis]
MMKRQVDGWLSAGPLCNFSVCIATCTLQRHLRAPQQSATCADIHRLYCKPGRHVRLFACIWKHAANAFLAPILP